MSIIKTCTDIPQSKVLAEFLSIESADMYYQYVLPKYDKIKHNPEIGNPINALEWYNKGYTMSGKEPITLDEFGVPCWSLAALLDVLPFHLIINNRRCAFTMHKGLNKDGETYMIRYNISNTDICLYKTEYYNNSIDACVNMIEKLHEQNLL